MEKYEEITLKFIQDMNYISNKHVLGIILYGSYITGHANKNSDIDLHIIMDNRDNTLYRGVKTVDGMRVEYFEKPISDIYESIDIDFLVNENAYHTIIGKGRILYAKNDELFKLKEYVLNKYKESLPPLEGDDALEMAYIISNRLIHLATIINIDDNEFVSNYFLVLEKIRKFYSRIMGLANIPTDKVYKIYNNKEYALVFGKSIPNEEFICLYNKCKDINLSNIKKLEYINDLFNYVVSNLDYHPDNYRIKIKSRNNPLNRNH